MQKDLFRFIALAAGVILASGCSSDSSTAPLNNGTPLSAAISSDIAASSGDAIASDVAALVANEAAAVASFAIVPVAPSFDDQHNDSTRTAPAPAQSNCTAAPSPGVFFCVNQPGADEHLKCTYSEEKKLYVCVKEETPPSPSQSTSGSGQPQPSSGGEQPQPGQPAQSRSESCTYDGVAFIYRCTKQESGKTVVKSYQFRDANGNPMSRFVRGTTESIHFLVKTDASESKEGYASVSHSLRDQVESGFLGPNRIWSGFGRSADTSSHSEGGTTRKYSGVTVDTLYAVAFVDQRQLHPYPLSGSAVRVVDYSVVASGEQNETTNVHKRVVVTFNGTADVAISVGDYNCVLHLDTHKVDSCK